MPVKPMARDRNDDPAKITTAELSELNKRYTLDAEDPEELAGEWLEANGF